MPDLPDATEEKVTAVLTEVSDGALVTKWLTIAETIDAESGQPQLEVMRSEAMSLWDMVGFLEYELAFIRRRIEFPRDGDA